MGDSLMQFTNPVTFPYILSSKYGEARPYGFHEGVDLTPKKSAQPPYLIVAASGGVVAQNGYMPEGYGYYIQINHPEGFSTVYGHLARPSSLTVGERVEIAHGIGYAGSTGNSTGIHLHLSVLRDGKPVDPMLFLPKAYTKVQIKGKGGITTPFERLLDSLPETTDCGDKPDTWADDDQIIKWSACIEKYLIGEDLDTFKDSVSDWLKANDPKQPTIDPTGVTGAVNEAMKGIYEQVINGVTWPARIYINSLKLSEVPLDSGLETLVWLREPEHQKLYFASITVLILAVIFFLIALNRFLGDPAGQVITVAVPEAALLKGAVGK
jgi:hypothetical protein